MGRFREYRLMQWELYAAQSDKSRVGSGIARFRATDSYQSVILEKGAMQASAGRVLQSVIGVEFATHDALGSR